VLSGLFSPPAAPPNVAPATPAYQNPAAASSWRGDSAESFAPPRAASVAPRPAPPAPAPPRAAAPSADTQKLRHEIRRLELLVKKLQAELEAQKQYCAALEADFKSMQETE